MITQTFEIKVAILGYVSVGKTTVLNALLQDKFSEVSMRRTTAGINFFRIAASQAPSNGTRKRKAVDVDTTLKPAVGSYDDDAVKVKVNAEESGGIKYAKVNNKNDDESNDGNQTLDEIDWSLVADEPRLAKSTLEEITADNQKLRAMKNTIQEKTFDIQLNEPLCKMRRDTTLVIMDVPGLNEADSKNVYQEYVEKTWDTLDCVIVVMDAEKGVNTDEQVELLRFVKKNLDESKQIPVIVLCNKVDDPDDEELMMLVDEMRAKVEQIYQVGNRTDALQALLKNAALDAAERGNDHQSVKMFPVFLPVSAGNAFAYRSASYCRTMEKFQQLDIKIIDKLGIDEVGTFKWKKLSLEEKYQTVFDAVSDSKEYKERLEATNFDKFLALLAYCVGGDDVQCQLLAKQVEISLRKLKLLGDTPVAVELRGVYDKCKVLNRDVTMLKDKFWTVFHVAAQKEYAACLRNMNLSTLHGLMDELIAYSSFVTQVGWAEDELQKIDEKMEELVLMQITTILEKEQDWKIDDSDLGRYRCYYVWKGDGWYIAFNNTLYTNDKAWFFVNLYPWTWERDGDGWRNVYTGAQKEGKANPASGTVLHWKTLTYYDWVTILSSLLLVVSHNMRFCERLGHEKMLLESRLQRHMFYANCLATNGKTEGEKNALVNIPIFMQGSYVDGNFIPSDPLMYRTVVQVVNPKLVSDPAHWGHLVWKFCNYMDKKQK